VAGSAFSPISSRDCRGGDQALPSAVPTILASRERLMNAHERPIISEDSKTAVRAGVTGNNVRYVLIGSVALAIVAWILVEYFVRP
jgi:hypothetical protein